MNVLIVDDSLAMRTIIQKTLNLSGLDIDTVFQAKNGEEALKVLEENWIDLALVDINMPVMDGETLINRVRDNPDISGLPIVVVSTESSEARIVELRSKDVEFIHKPFAPETLRETVFQLTGAENGASTIPSGNFDF
jgi:two-component system, chemotaxis family, chemotaxis protein CheY